ncbi:hypothetical protein NEMBOFW57_004226 [Staphylotrichum longicolle]|uniref:Uncharacterized protein n=1 Tax=Staphylotrichum longicolle TaxID=669026 RepID=A0AAD4FBC3_9PEZI|nr:hypothetical protein NEMBOFW57_004226 [Staphylotrichum longicolle]
MCTYDYTPYTGCEDGEQHFYIQWVKCSVAVEKGRYCPLDTSHKVEQLRKLSANVLSCPLHGPVAVQQYVLDAVNARPQDSDRDTRRARSAARRGATSRGRTPKRGTSDRDSEQPVRREVRKQRSRRSMASESTDSESSTSLSTRARAAAAQRVPSLAERERLERRKSRTAQNSHRRSISADVALPPPPTLTMRYGRSEASLPLKADPEVPTAELPAPVANAQQAPSKPSLDIPRAIGVVGLPSSPDMHHRRGSVHRSRSEGVLRKSTESQPEAAQPAPRSAVSPASDNSSPEQNPDLPFSSLSRRNRRAGSRSIRDRSVDTTMRRIDEQHEAAEQHTAAAREAASPDHGPASLPPTTTTPRRSDSLSRPRLNALHIPAPPANPLQRDAYSAPTATPPETDITGTPSHHTHQPPHHHTLRSRAKSLRHIDLSPPPQIPSSSSQINNEDAASLRSAASGRSRRFEHQVAEGRKWVAAREHMAALPATPVGKVGAGAGAGVGLGLGLGVTDVLAHMSEPNLAAAVATTAAAAVAVPPGGAARESVDSGYRSGHGHGHQVQRSWETVTGAAATASVSSSSGSRVGGGEEEGRHVGNARGGKLQKAAPPPPLLQQQQQQQQQRAGD